MKKAAIFLNGKDITLLITPNTPFFFFTGSIGALRPPLLLKGVCEEEEGGGIRSGARRIGGLGVGSEGSSSSKRESELESVIGVSSRGSADRRGRIAGVSLDSIGGLTVAIGSGVTSLRSLSDVGKGWRTGLLPDTAAAAARGGALEELVELGDVDDASAKGSTPDEDLVVTGPPTTGATPGFSRDAGVDADATAGLDAVLVDAPALLASSSSPVKKSVPNPVASTVIDTYTINCMCTYTCM